MRTILYLAALATATTATAACANDIPLPDLTNSSILSVSRAPAVTLPLLPPLQHVDVVDQKASGNDPFNRLKGAVRHRFASSMIDLYPSDASGFHASVGTRFFKKQYIRRDQEEETNGLLYNPRLPRGASGQRGGFKRATPAATFGYNEMIRSNFMVGLEAGTLLGRVVQPLSRHLGSAAGSRDASFRVNPVVNMTVAYAF